MEIDHNNFIKALQWESSFFYISFIFVPFFLKIIFFWEKLDPTLLFTTFSKNFNYEQITLLKFYFNITIEIKFIYKLSFTIITKYRMQKIIIYFILLILSERKYIDSSIYIILYNIEVNF